MMATSSAVSVKFTKLNDATGQSVKEVMRFHAWKSKEIER